MNKYPNLEKWKLFNGPIPPWIKERSWLKTIKYKPWVSETIIRDGYKCVDCFDGSKKLLVHHIDESRKKGKLNNNVSNLISLCKKCHSRRHGLNKNDIENKLKAYTLLTGDKIPHGLLAIIARELGVSRERVRQIAKKEGYVMPRRVVKMNRNRVCDVCGKKFYSKAKKKRCSEKCSLIHRKKAYYTTSQCKWCGKEIEYLRSKKGSGRERKYCSKKCQGKYIGENYGFSKQKLSKKELIRRRKKILMTVPQFFTINKFSEITGYSNTYSSIKVNRMIKMGLVKFSHYEFLVGRPHVYINLTHS